MDHRSLVLCLSSATLAATTGVYGFKFVRKRNFLLGFEWWIVTISASNAVIFFATESPVSYFISHFLDAFSRGFGMPVIAVAGLMAVTHGYRPSIRQDVTLFVLATLGTIALVAGVLQHALPYFYVAMWTLMSIYLAGFAWRLARAGHALHALTTTLALVASQAIACIYDFYRSPGEDPNVFSIFYVLALLTWLYLTVALYYAYGALEREKGRSRTGAGVLSYPK